MIAERIRAAEPPLGRSQVGRGHEAERAAAGALGELVLAIGGADFPARFLDAMRALSGAELCSAFRRDGDGVALLFAAGEAQHVSDFPQRASRDYARDYWRSDIQLAHLARGGGRTRVVVRRRVSEIVDPIYRAACYERAGVIERISIVEPGPPILFANGYRLTTAAPFGIRDIERIEVHAGLLIACLRQHMRANEAAGYLFNEKALAETLVALDCGLSVREAEVAAALILGQTQDEIARARHLSPATVITYRRRAYGKLGVANRRDLAALHRRLMTGSAMA